MPNERDADSRARLERLMVQHGSHLLRLSALYLKDADLAQDAVQETFLKAYRHLSNYRGDASDKTWLTAICINVCRDLQKSAWFRHRSSVGLDSLREGSADFTFPDNTVLTEVMNLPSRYREVVLLRYYEGLKLKDVASALHLSEGKVRARLKHACDILHGRLKEWYDDEGT